jgi:hypothetical protein
MKKIDFKIIFNRVRKVRKKSHLSNVAFQRDHLSCFVCHLNQEKTWRIIRWNRKWSINRTINYWINRILDEKISSEVEFDNHFHAFVQLINRCRFILFSIIHSESQHIKYRINFVNLDFQRSEASFRATLLSWFFWFSRSFDYEMHEKCHWFAANFEIVIIQKNHERLKSRRMIKDHEKRKKILLINETWKLINFLKDRRVFRDKRVCKIKRKKHDEILRYKTRWVIWDFE